MVFGIGDELSVRVTAQTVDFTRGINRAQESLQDLRRTANSTSAALTGLAGAATSSSVGLRAVGIATVGSAIPALAALATTIAPLVASFTALAGAATALAGAFGLVVGSGLIAFGEQRAEQNKERLEQINAQIDQLEALEEQEGSLTEQQKEELTTLKERRDTLQEQTTITGGLTSATVDLREEIAPLVVEFGSVFIPLIEDAIDALPALVENTLDAVGGLQTFVEALRDFGQFAFEVIPEVTAFFAELARNSVDDLRNLTDFITNTATGTVAELRMTVDRLESSFADFGSAVIRLLPSLNRVGIVVTNAILPTLTRGAELLNRVSMRFLQLESGIRKATAQAAVFAPVFTAILGLLLSITGPIGLVAGALGSLAIAWRTNFLNIRELLGSSLRPLRQEFEFLRTPIQSLIQFATQLAQAFSSGFQLTNERSNLENLERILKATRTVIRQIRPEVIELAQNLGRLSGAAIENAPAIIRAIGNALDTVLDIINAITPALVTLINLLGGAAEAWNKFVRSSERAEEEGVLFRNVPFTGGADIVPDATVQAQQRGRVTGTNVDETRVVVEPSSELNATIQDEAETRAELVVQQQSDQAQRNSGSSGLSGL